MSMSRQRVLFNEPAYYRVGTIDPDDDHPFGKLTIRAPRCRKWTIRRVLRRLYSQGYDTVSVYVERIT